MDGPEPELTVRRRSSAASSQNAEDTRDGAVDDGDPAPSDVAHQQPQRTHRSLPVRALWFTVGIISLGLGGLGIILPGLPTTPFVLLAAFAFLRSSERFHKWLLRSRLFGPILVAWEEHRALPSRRVKIVAVLFTIAVFSASIVYFAAFSDYWWASLILGALCVAVCTFLIRLPVVHSSQPPSGQ